MKRMMTLIVLLCALAVPALAEDAEMDGECVYTLVDESGAQLTCRAGRMYVGDEYIASDNSHYQVTAVDDARRVATASYIGIAQLDPAASAAFVSLVARAEPEKRIAMYSTHSDESYVPSDGESSKIEDAGIYDVGNALKDSFERLGIEVEYSQDTFHPHDAGAYRRSRRTAEELLRDSPDALLDIHRDAIPAEEYETEVDGEEMSMVRLFVGRSNPNGAENRAFAQQIKAVADEEYPGLVKDIYIGKGNYNQELYPRALLLEMGTHEIEKEKAMASTDYIAQVISQVLYGDAAQAEGAAGATQSGGVATGIFWVIGGVIVAAVVYALASTGRLSAIWRKIRRSTSEITGGAIGEKPDPREKRR